MSAVLAAAVALGCLGGCQDVSIGRQVRGDGGIEVRRERVLPMPDAQIELRALDVGPTGEVILLVQFTGTADFGDADPRTATSTGGDGVLLMLDPDLGLRAKRVLAADFLTLYRAVLDQGQAHLAGLFRGRLSDGDELADSPSSQAAVFLSYDLGASRTSVRTLGSLSGLGNVQGKGVDGQADRMLRCGNYLDAFDAGDGAVVSAGAAGDNAYATVSDATGALWTRTLATPENGARGAYGQNCRFQDDGGVVLVGDFDGTATVGDADRSADGLDGFVVAYTSDGGLRWSRIIGGAGDQELSPLAMRADVLLIAGQSSATFPFGGGSVDGSSFVAALGLDGTEQWAWSIGGQSVLTSLDASGVDIVASGFFSASIEALGWSPAGERDGLVVGLRDDGSVRWAYPFGSRGEDACLAHAAGAGVVVVCVFGSTLESPGGAQIPEGGSLWIANVAAPG